MAKAAAPPRNVSYAQVRYGLEFDGPKDQYGRQIAPLPDAQIELHVLRNYQHLVDQGRPVLSWSQHFKRFVSSIWDTPDTKYRFSWNPYAEKMLEGACQHNFLGIAGHASSGKSQFGAIWAIARFLIGSEGPDGEKDNPSRYIKVFVTSTTLEESRQRIWGVVENYWRECCACFGGEEFMPGVLVSSRGKIVYRGPDGKRSELAGIALIPGGKGQDADVDRKIGFKARTVIMIADELPLLTHRLYESAKGNLFSNPHFQMLGIGNPTSVFDPFGVFTEPKDGWASVNEDYDGWETKLGYCIRFDGEKSPNVQAGREVYAGLLTLEKVISYREMHGPKSFEYFRMVRGFICPTGAADSIYTEQEIVASMSMKPVRNWIEKPIPIAFLDPSFSKGGDKAAAAFGQVGTVQGEVSGVNKKVMECLEVVDLMLRVDAKHPSKDRNQQLAELFVEECTKRGVTVPDRGCDSTGGGDPFASILAILQGHGMQLVSFAGKASEMSVSMTDNRPADKKYANRVTELWYVGKEFMRGGQLKGIPAHVALDLCGRTYKAASGDRVIVESKDDMKARTNGKSPDFGDAWVGLIEICRRKHGFATSARALKRSKPFKSEDPLASMFDWAKAKTAPVFAQETSYETGGAGWADYS